MIGRDANPITRPMINAMLIATIDTLCDRLADSLLRSQYTKNSTMFEAIAARAPNGLSNADRAARLGGNGSRRKHHGKRSSTNPSVTQGRRPIPESGGFIALRQHR